MEALYSLIGGFESALTPMNLLWVVIGALLGTAVGVLPGLGSSMAVALLLPVTFSMDPAAAFIMFAGIYFGGLFGDSTAGILANTPGQSSAIATTIEGHRMALSGRAPQALATAAIGAFIGGLIATVLVGFGAPVMAGLVSSFGPPEFFALAITAFLAVASVVSDSVLKGLASLVLGLGIAVVGIDVLSGTVRFTAGSVELLDGVDFVIVTVGLLAVGEVLKMVFSNGDNQVRTISGRGRAWLSRSEFRQAIPAWLRGTAFGLPFGVIPAGGAEIPTFLSYGTEKRLDSRRKDPQFGKGAIQGVAGPEAAANATTGMAMGALLTLGLPVSATAAIMLAAFQQYGLQPGPLLFERSPDLVWTLIASLFVGLVVLLAINLPFAPLWAKLLLIPRPYLYAGIAVFSCLGVYALNSSVWDVFLLIAVGVVGLLMRQFDIPIAPALIGVILGPLAETELRRTLAINEGQISGLFTPVSVPIYAVLGIIVGVSIATKVIDGRKTKRATAAKTSVL
ncbi:putative tricarboxylic transport membrane protein [Arthrobacter sp. 31Cvi3.1E]|nr:putative tricarboxylic transport membrane protein [Arthrobacter sp. 31Cvi3.1E]